MATSSITKNFVISGKEQVEMFVNAIEESAKNRPAHIPRSRKRDKGRIRIKGNDAAAEDENKGERKWQEMISFFRSISVSIWH